MHGTTMKMPKKPCIQRHLITTIVKIKIHKLLRHEDEISRQTIKIRDCIKVMSKKEEHTKNKM